MLKVPDGVVCKSHIALLEGNVALSGNLELEVGSTSPGLTPSSYSWHLGYFRDGGHSTSISLSHALCLPTRHTYAQWT